MNQKELYKMSSIELYKMVLKGNKIKKFPNGFWQQPEAKQNAKEITKYFIEEILKWDKEKLLKNMKREVFSDYKLKGMMTVVYNCSTYEAINAVYPNIKPWQLMNSPRNYWNRDTAKLSIKWLVEEKLKWTIDDLKKKINATVFDNNGLKGMLCIVFKGSVYEAISLVYPDIKPWELSQTPINYWNQETGLLSIKWLFFEKLKWTEKEIVLNLCTNIFIDNGLRGMFDIVYKSSPYNVLNVLYPNKYKQWELKAVPNNYWTNQNAKLALKWLIEEKLNWTKEDIEKNISSETFISNGLKGMLSLKYNNRIFDALNDVYPNKFDKEKLYCYRFR